MSSSSKDLLRKAGALLEALEARPEDAPADQESLEWWLADQVHSAISASRATPSGVPRKVSRGWPRVLADVPIVAWATQAQVARFGDVDVRTVQRWEGKGLPHRGEGRTKRYPVPHGVVWVRAYRSLRRRQERVGELPMKLAFAESARINAVLVAD